MRARAKGEQTKHTPAVGAANEHDPDRIDTSVPPTVWSAPQSKGTPSHASICQEERIAESSSDPG